ncbi:MAG: hypothetical protein EZS28_021248 [Streblomastix strix]|uniref:Uncharacterized protein n=1 Tax=Streblomastix strix TaxID=222440 RepID=A0A5J4VL46_9EUKA|nr:MAG: hypothetical protein EZS28_021248 [Streblomastix strix]
MDTIDNVGEYPIHSVTPTIKGQQSLHIKTFGGGVALILFVNLIVGVVTIAVALIIFIILFATGRSRMQEKEITLDSKQGIGSYYSKPVLFGYCCCIKTHYREFKLEDIVDVQPVALQETVARSRVHGVTRRRTYMQMQTYRVQFEFNDGEKYWPDMQLTQDEILQINRFAKSYQERQLQIREIKQSNRASHTSPLNVSTNNAASYHANTNTSTDLNNTTNTSNAAAPQLSSSFSSQQSQSSSARRRVLYPPVQQVYLPQPLYQLYQPQAHRADNIQRDSKRLSHSYSPSNYIDQQQPMQRQNQQPRMSRYGFGAAEQY